MYAPKAGIADLIPNDAIYSLANLHGNNGAIWQ